MGSNFTTLELKWEEGKLLLSPLLLLLFQRYRPLVCLQLHKNMSSHLAMCRPIREKKYGPQLVGKKKNHKLTTQNIFHEFVHTIGRGDPCTYHFDVPDQSSCKFHPYHQISWYWLLAKCVTSFTPLIPHRDLSFVIQGPLSGPQIHCRELRAHSAKLWSVRVRDWANIHTFVAIVYSYFREQISMFTDEFFRDSMALFQFILRPIRIRRIRKSMS
jgi:hypothetical protein